MKKDFLPIILGCDENAYGNVRLIREAYDVRPLLLCRKRLIPSLYSKLFDIVCRDGIDRDEIFVPVLYDLLKQKKEEYEKSVLEYEDVQDAMEYHHRMGKAEGFNDGFEKGMESCI